MFFKLVFSARDNFIRLYYPLYCIITKTTETGTETKTETGTETKTETDRQTNQIDGQNVWFQWRCWNAQANEISEAVISSRENHDLPEMLSYRALEL